MHRLLRYLGDYTRAGAVATVGEVRRRAGRVEAREAQASRVALTPSGQRVSLDGEGPEVLELTEQGFYEIRAQGRDAEPAVVVASNVDLAESDMTPLDPAEVVGRGDGPGRAGRAKARRRRRRSDDAQEGAQRIWWYLMFAGLLFLAAETVVGNSNRRS